MSDKIELSYDEKAKAGTLNFPNGRKLRLSNVTKEQAENFAARHGAEFERRDCILHTGGTVEKRGV